ncbi:cytochrome c oxidase cbb3-type subunit 3 [Pedobacter cryoconitis]|uniref:Cytochrome c oxidase cbb3-type subunit 3 n=1 Tax=Pedobacter cryoconitis TaxID=188932 RepID=A0A7W8YTT7_9SPHI|nr:cbb3-type cytochrome c oxidase N-terminal domain-containing protein [Pedobacter cryoconitis]MBB5621390.1 cytochrome c oxidase cbb3-type subunit 3 [Pedobacter cryoconitis]MBB5643725.1 cytochrome c oxidase cbb3-type subunit 3 [Pedobacter cryoconitis]
MKEVINSNWSTGSTSADIVIGLMLITAIMILCVTLLMLKVIKFYVKESINPTPFATPQEKEKRRLEQEALQVIKDKKPSIWTKLMQLKPMEEEKNLVMEHKFDGIAELNNPTPAWFMILFYGTIIFAIGYLLTYDVLGFGKSQEEEYIAEIEQAAESKVAFLANPANVKNAVNENNMEQSKDEAIIKNGASLFANRCTPCHGEHGEGIVGPNLTDEYWLHGGKAKDVFKTIKYGVPEKGMIAWEKSLSAQQISDLTNYVLSLQGTKPAGAKAPQGNKE